MKYINYIGWLFGSLVMFGCQNEETLENLYPDEIYSLVANIGDDPLLSRAQIQLGRKESGGEHFFWNKGDQFALYQHKGNRVDSTVFTINEYYSEPDSGSAVGATFRSSTPAQSGGYIAVYPAHLPQNDERTIQFNVQQDLDFTDAVTPEQKAEVWKDYLKNNLFMVAKGDLNSDGANMISFKHMCSMIRISLKNDMHFDMNLNRIRLGGKQYYMINGSYLVEPGFGFFGGSLKTNGYVINTKNLKIAPGETEDIYILFMPDNFMENGYITINIDGYPFLYVLASDLINQNPGATGFEAGKRYWFKMTHTMSKIVWDKDILTFTGETITVDNINLSNMLYELYGERYVTLNEDGKAVCCISFADWITELNLNNRTGFERLDGLEVFPNLKRLTARSAGLKSVDLTGGEGITYLDLSYNPGITELDLSKNLALTDLQLTDMPISSIDLSKHVNLEDGLLLVDMPITKLDLSKNVKLKQLNCRSCLIPELDITPLTALEKLYCGGQRNNINIKVYMTEAQKELWDKEWHSRWENTNVTPIIK